MPFTIKSKHIWNAVALTSLAAAIDQWRQMYAKAPSDRINNETMQTMNNKITDIQEKFTNSDLPETVKARVISGLDSVVQNTNTIINHNNKIDDLSKKLAASGGVWVKPTNLKEGACLQSIKYNSNEITTSSVDNKETLEKLQDFIMDYNSRNKFTSSGTDLFNQFQDIFKNLSLVDLCILIDIIGILIIFSCVMSIIFAYYGNYLISKYTLDQKFPRLSKLINLRVKFQHYSIFINLFLIIVTLIILLLINLLTFLR